MKCQKCKKRIATDIHHKDDNHKNNKPRNLQKLCGICHSELHGIEPRVSELKRRVTYFSKAQKVRLAIENSLRGFSRIELIVPKELLKELDRVKKLEANFEKEIKNYIQKHPTKLSDWALSIKGISYVLVAKILGEIDWNKTKSSASLWKYAGYSVGDKKRKGIKANWNHRLKDYCYQIGDEFVKCRTPKYREVYDREKKKQLQKGLKKGHADMRARRKAIKVFLRDLFLRRERE